jgi:5-methylcytosine-specific restriction endonuclease McrA
MGHTKSACNSCRSNDRGKRLERKRRMVTYKGGACQLCGYSRCLRALDFHHVEPGTKLFNFSGNSLRSWESVRAELDKCVLVCSNCHDEIEEGTTEIPPRILNAILESIKDVPRIPRRGPGRPSKEAA